MRRKEENLKENHNTSMFSEIHNKQSIEEENLSCSWVVFCRKAKNEGGNLKSKKSQDYDQKPHRN